MENSTARLYQAANELKGLKTPSQVARALNTSPQTVKNWESRGISKDGLLRAQEVIGVSAHWLETGRGNMEIKTAIVPESNASYLGVIDAWDSSTPIGDDGVEVPFYKEVCLSAGNGFADDIEDYNGYKLRFSRASLRRHGILPSDVVCVTADGDSMTPVIPDGTTLGINKADKTIKDGKIYAINHGGLLRTKILKKRPGERVLIQSYNSEEYPDEEISLEEISIIGRVFWWSVLN